MLPKLLASVTALSFFLVVDPALADESASPTGCFANGWTKVKFQALRDRGFELPEASKQTLSEQLMQCLSDPDPFVRDKVAYEALFTWLRAGDLSSDTQLTLITTALHKFTSPMEDPHGVSLPFNALVLSELVRADRIQNYLQDSQRQDVVNILAAYLTNLRDYRGYDDAEGWRHGVAHSADVVLQLALNPKIQPQALKTLASSIASQINPRSLHFYQYGEPERLARAVVYLMIREELDIAFWHAWLAEVASPDFEGSWREAFSSNARLANRHNVREFLSQLFTMIAPSDNARLEAMKPVILEQFQSTS